MSQMNQITARNLYEFGDYFKKSLVLSIIVVICTPMLFLGLINFVLGSIIIFVLAIGGIVILVFRILMLIRLYRAKESSPHPDLVRAFQYIMIAIIVSAASIVLFFSVIMQGIAHIVAVVLELLAWQSFAKYMVVYSSETAINQGFSMIAEGIKSYILYIYISLAISVANFIVEFFNDPEIYEPIDTVLIIIAIPTLVIGILIIMAQFKIANGMLLIFGGIPPTQTSFQYGTPPPSFQQGSGSVEKFCMKCGAKLIPGAKFCTSCGNSI